MSRRATTPEARGKRSHSFGAESSAEKRAKRDGVPVNQSPRDDEATGTSNAVSMFSSSSTSQVRGNPGLQASDLQRRDRYLSQTPSPGSSRSDNSQIRRGSPSRPSTEHSNRTRPTWQTGPSEPSEQGWSREREREREREGERDSRETGGTRDSRDSRERDLRATSTNPSRGLTPPSGVPSSSGGLLQAQPPRTQAAFVNKLYSMLEDTKISESGLLYWSADGTSFVCPNPSEFAKDVLPNYFKHNNWQSFVRQLNMYSFNKVSDLYSTANSDPQAWEFRHSKFLRGRPDLLPLIKRKPTRQNQTEPSSVMASPGDDQDKPVTGWAAGPSHPTNYARYASPTPRDYRSSFYAAHTGPMSSSYEAGLSRSPPRAHIPPALGGRPPSHSGYPAESSRSEPPYYPHAHSQPPPSRQQPALDTVSSQVASLQDTVNRLWTTLQHERYDNASRSLDMTNHLIRMSDWVGDIGKTRIPVDMLHRQRTDLINRLEALQSQGSEVYPAPATGHGDRHLGSSFPPPPRSMQSAMHDHHSLHGSHHESLHVPERVRPATSEAAFHYSRSSPRSYPAPSHRLPSGGDFRYGLPHSDEPGPSRGNVSLRSSSQRRDVDDLDDKGLDFDSKTSLRNLLH